MKIERIELYHVAMPLIAPWRTAYGEDAEIHSVLCRMCGGSVDGWGESSPLAAPCYSPEWAGGAFAVARDWLAPSLIGQIVSEPGQLLRRLDIYKGNPFAKAALDNAWWSMRSRRDGEPLHVALSRFATESARPPRNEVPVGADFGVTESLDQLMEEIGQAIQDGFPRIKLKFRPGWDLPMLEAVRRRYPDQTMHIDCNSGYRLSDIAMFRRIDEFRLAMIEQPLAHDDLLDHAELQTQIQTPVCLDESITHPGAARQALSLSSCRYVNVKPGRVGGLTNAVIIHDLCSRARIPCWVGGMLESAVGAAHCASLAMLNNFTYPADIFPSSRFYRQDLSDPPLELAASADGAPCVRAPATLPEPSAERLKRLTLQRATVRDAAG